MKDVPVSTMPWQSWVGQRSYRTAPDPLRSSSWGHTQQKGVEGMQAVWSTMSFVWGTLRANMKSAQAILLVNTQSAVLRQRWLHTICGADITGYVAHMAKDTLSFADVRLIAYNKNPDNSESRAHVGASSYTCIHPKLFHDIAISVHKGRCAVCGRQ